MQTSRRTGGALGVRKRSWYRYQSCYWYFWKVMEEQQQNIRLNFLQHQMSYWSFRQRGKMQEVGALRTLREGGNTANGYVTGIFRYSSPVNHPPARQACGSSHFPDQEARSPNEAATCLKGAANHRLSWQGSRLTIFIALLQQGLKNWTQPRKTKELWGCVRPGLLYIYKKKD